ncbi:MAG: TlpA disulfide reductase family protein [Clostridium sp.]
MKKIIYGALLVMGLNFLVSCSKGSELDNSRIAINKENKEFTNSQMQKPPTFSVMDVNGKKFTLEDYKGNIIVLNFFNIWNGDSIKEAKYFEEIYKTYGNKGVEVLRINSGDKLNDVKQYIKENPIASSNMLLDLDKKITNQYGVENAPTTFIINKEGYVFARYAKPITKEELISGIDSLLQHDIKKVN